MHNLLKAVNWGKVLEKASYAVTIAVAISGAISDHNKEKEFNQMKKDLAKLKKGKS